VSIAITDETHSGPLRIRRLCPLPLRVLLAFGFVVWTVGTVATPPPLPEARANNPVARIATGDAVLWFTALGIGPAKTWRDLHADGWIFRAGVDERWQPVPALPAFEGLAGRLGSHAVAIDGQVHVIGGYTVAEDHAERSTPGIYRLSFEARPEWMRVATMPVAVDDAVALVQAERYLYLVSGWSDTGNVNLVQVWDSRENTWRQAEPWPGTPVFGHAGGMLDDRMVICGGARIVYPVEGPRQFHPSSECWLGAIREDDRYRLDWKPLPPMPGGPRYRAGAIGIRAFGADSIVFAGGADRPYNYDGQGYDGVPARALDSIVSYDLDAGRWVCHSPMPAPGMDYRGLLVSADRLVLIGGMNAERQPTARIMAFELSPPRRCSEVDRAAGGL